MPVSTIFENLEAGASIDDILEWFEGLDRDQVKAVINSQPAAPDLATPTTSFTLSGNIPTFYTYFRRQSGAAFRRYCG
jgi:hypothetical protein